MNEQNFLLLTEKKKNNFHYMKKINILVDTRNKICKLNQPYSKSKLELEFYLSDLHSTLT